MKKTLLVAALATTTGLSACAPHQYDDGMPDIPERPTAQWVESYLPAYRHAAIENPSIENVTRYQRLLELAGHQEASNRRLANIDRQLTLAYDNFGRGGAAQRQPGYVHVVHEEFNYVRDAMGRMSMDTLASELAASVVGIDEPKALEILNKIKNIDPPPAHDRGFDWIVGDATGGYSMYEIGRWGRFCDNGKGMDEADWKFITQEGRDRVPEMFSSCEMPTHDYYHYLRAWGRFCEAGNPDVVEPTRADRDIVRDSVRPQTIVNPCRALNL